MPTFLTAIGPQFPGVCGALVEKRCGSHEYSPGLPEKAPYLVYCALATPAVARAMIKSTGRLSTAMADL